ncbi:MAG: signal peptidase I [Lachnospiraceae bacterium]|nr:signal peptidase I [Lachnospiraceae bacterium]
MQLLWNRSGSDGKKEKNMNTNAKKMIKEILAWVLTIALAVVAARVINKYVIIKAEVPTGSMESTIEVDDCILGFQLAYLFNNPERGDIVIFPWPDNPEVTYVKRVIGLPGETVEIKDGAVYINGEPIEEPYLKEEMAGEYGPYVVPEGCYFMMGDNRNSSQDSRRWKNTFLKEEDIMAKVLFRYSPSFQWYSDVEYK